MFFTEVYKTLTESPKLRYLYIYRYLYVSLILSEIINVRFMNDSLKIPRSLV